jgi:hypothetical protein
MMFLPSMVLSFGYGKQLIRIGLQDSLLSNNIGKQISHIIDRVDYI